MSSSLHDKINSYAIENGIEFDEAFVLPPTQTGTVTNYTAAYWSMIGRNPVYEPTVGPAGGSGSWKYVINETNGCRLRNNGGTILTLIADNDYSIGVWVMPTVLKVGGTAAFATGVYQHGPTASAGFAINIAGGAYSTPYCFNLFAAGVSYDITDVIANLGQWYYVAVVRSGTNLKFYIDGVLKKTVTNMGSATGNVQTWSDAVTAGSADFRTTLNISNYYNAPTSVINESEIAEIWTAGSTAPTPVNYSASPMTASAESVDPSLKIDDIFSTTPAEANALMTEPTIATTIGDHTEITTSITASAEFPSNFAVDASQNINITITETLDASTELINNVSIVTGSDESFGAAEFIATAEFIEPVPTRAPMLASALMVNPSVSVNPSYFNLVLGDDPVFYTNLDQTTITNYGSWGVNDNETRGSTVTREVDSGGNMQLVGEGDSWRFDGDYNNAPNYVRVAGPDATTLANLITGDFTVEYWFYKSNTFNSGAGLNIGGKFELIYNNLTYIPIEDPKTHSFILNITSVTGGNFASGTRLRILGPADSVIDNIWNHVVLTSTGNQARVWVNGSLIINTNFTQDGNWYNALTTNPGFISYNASRWDNTQDEEATTGKNGALIDELAIYDDILTNSEIIDRFSFINNLDPNPTFYPTPFQAQSESGNHQFVVTSNVNAIATPIIASTDFVMPSVLAQKTINYSAPTLTASALNTDVTIYYGWTIYADPAIAFAEKPEGYPLNTIYYDYVQANIAPYRYVSFDDANPYTDFGTDNDYSVTPTVVGGIIVNPDLGINGKSAKTAGLNYATDGVILKESEWDDSWGTGQNSYHSAFWFQRALDDTSTTGLRVLWNLNGYKDNQHVVLYQYQNKLHMQFNNASGTWIEQDTGTLDLFDYERHFVLIEFDHTNVNNNTVRLYVDAILRSTINLGTYTGQTTNATTADSGPNDEANNHARLSVGCLITPFAATALPVIPTNTKLIIDEVYWDKNSIDATMIANLYNVMPDKTNVNVIALSFEASAEMIAPLISTEINRLVDPANASAEFVNPNLYIERFIAISIDPMNASADMGDAIGFVQIDINADVMVATATFDDAGVIIAVPGTTMHAYVNFPSNIKWNLLPLSDLTPYIKYLRYRSTTTTIYPIREIV